MGYFAWLNLCSSSVDTIDLEEDVVEKKGIMLKGAPLYLDMQATTPIDPRVIDAMMPYLTEQYGNPHSRTHLYGWEAEDAVEDARAQVASLIGADAKEIVFTSGATESNNMAIKGVGFFYKDKKKHLIACQVGTAYMFRVHLPLADRGRMATWDQVFKETVSRAVFIRITCNVCCYA